MQKTCKERIQEEYQDRLEQIQTEEEPPFLCFDYVEPNTFEGQNIGYYRYQMGYGGPSDEFRKYDNKDFIEYWFLDWFDGASIVVKDADVINLVNDFINNYN